MSRRPEHKQLRPATSLAHQLRDQASRSEAPLGIAISRATMRNVYQNLVGAFAYNSLGLPVALGVLYPLFGLLLSPILAAAAMSFSSVTVITNANRLKRFKLQEVSA